MQGLANEVQDRKKIENVVLRHVPGLDGLRGIAVLLVVFFHSGYLKFGWIGVQLFFVLSGYLISSILLESRRHSFSFYLKKFYWRRVLRIFPLNYAVLIIITVWYLFTQTPPQFVDHWPYLYSYTFNMIQVSKDFAGSGVYEHFWSLSVEEQFYLVWPFVIFFVSPRKMVWVSLGLIILIPVACYLFGEVVIANGGSTKDVAELAYYLTIFQAGGFAAGAYAALVHRGHARSYFPNWIAAATVVLAFGLLNVWWSRHVGENRMSWVSLGFPRPELSTANGQHIWGYVIINFMSVILIHAVIMKDKLLSFLDFKPLVEVGKLSYGIYVFHFPIWRLVYAKTEFVPFTLKGILIFTGYFIVVMLFSVASYYLFEEKFLRLKDKYFFKPLNPSPS